MAPMGLPQAATRLRRQAQHGGGLGQTDGHHLISSGAQLSSTWSAEPRGRSRCEEGGATIQGDTTETSDQSDRTLAVRQA